MCWACDVGMAVDAEFDQVNVAFASALRNGDRKQIVELNRKRAALFAKTVVADQRGSDGELQCLFPGGCGTQFPSAQLFHSGCGNADHVFCWPCAFRHVRHRLLRDGLLPSCPHPACNHRLTVAEVAAISLRHAKIVGGEAAFHAAVDVCALHDLQVEDLRPSCHEETTRFAEWRAEHESEIQHVAARLRLLQTRRTALEKDAERAQRNGGDAVESAEELVSLGDDCETTRATLALLRSSAATVMTKQFLLVRRAELFALGAVECPGRNCGNWFACRGIETCVQCNSCALSFCKSCRTSPFHFGCRCSELPALVEASLEWQLTGQGEFVKPLALKWPDRYGSCLARWNGDQDQRFAVELLRRERRREAREDEEWKGRYCRLCPHCRRVVERIDGCPSMTCGRDASDKGGGNQQNGCGQYFDWNSAPPYVPCEPPVVDFVLPSDIERALAVEHVWCDGEPLLCGICNEAIIGPRLSCLHCEVQFFCCFRCDPQNHDPKHAFCVDWVSQPAPRRCAPLPRRLGAALGAARESVDHEVLDALKSWLHNTRQDRELSVSVREACLPALRVFAARCCICFGDRTNGHATLVMAVPPEPRGLDAVGPVVRRSVEWWLRHAKVDEPSGLLELPPSLSVWQKKQLHVWAAERGIQSKSFGEGSERRLSLRVVRPPTLLVTELSTHTLALAQVAAEQGLVRAMGPLTGRSVPERSQLFLLTAGAVMSGKHHVGSSIVSVWNKTGGTKRVGRAVVRRLKDPILEACAAVYGLSLEHLQSDSTYRNQHRDTLNEFWAEYSEQFGEGVVEHICGMLVKSVIDDGGSAEGRDGVALVVVTDVHTLQEMQWFSSSNVKASMKLLVCGCKRMCSLEADWDFEWRNDTSDDALLRKWISETVLLPLLSEVQKQKR